MAVPDKGMKLLSTQHIQVIMVSFVKITFFNSLSSRKNKKELKINFTIFNSVLVFFNLPHSSTNVVVVIIKMRKEKESIKNDERDGKNAFLSVSP